MLLALLLTLAASAPVYPIAPVPLHELVARSDLVAVVVPRPLEPGVGERGWTMERVELLIEEVLVGNQFASVTTSYLQGMLCPGPPEYPEGERVLAFLDHDEESGWEAVGLHYGTKQLDPATLEIYRARIRELDELISARPKRWRDTPAFVEWLVRCAEEPATRWEGAYALEPSADTRWDFEFDPPPAGLRHRLGPTQRSRLLTVLLETRSIGNAELCLMQALADEPGTALDDFALERLSELVPKDPQLAAPILVLLAERSGDAEARRIAREFDEQWWRARRGDEAFFAASVAALVQRVRGLR